jgi:hypothetical protein
VVFRGFPQSLEISAGIVQDKRDETESLGIFDDDDDVCMIRGGP